ncbi:MAG: CocE/NonD family hydrolase [Actinomycetota bacterium]
MRLIHKPTFLPVILVAVLGVGLTGPAASGSSGAASDQSTEGDPRLCHDPSTRPISRVTRPPKYKVLPGQVVELESEFDGAAIQMAVVRPKVPSGVKTPVIVFASPYLDHNLEVGDMAKCAIRLVENFVPQGYTIGFVAVRGTADSGGCSDLMGDAERADLNQAVNWFGSQSWSNGRVGMIGVSYDGSTPWEVASLGNRYLKTIVPISGVSDVYHLMFHDGTTELRGPLVLNALYYLYNYAPVIANGQQYPTSGRSMEHTVGDIVCPEAWKGLTASVHSTLTGERDLLGYWAERNSRPGVERNYRGSIFIARGLQDWNVNPAHDFPWVFELERSGLYVKYMLGQWTHAWPDSNITYNGIQAVRWDWADVLLDWWDYWLKGDRSVDLGPRAQIQDSIGLWRNESGWPPPQAREEKLFLTPDGRLSAKPSRDSGTKLLTPDPTRPFGSTDLSRTDPSRCPVCAIFEFGEAKDELRFGGISKLDVTVTPTGPGGHLSAWLYSVQSGSAKRVGWGQIDLRFARGGGKAIYPVPGEPLRVELALEPLDVVIPAGERLVLVVSQGTYGDSDHIQSVPSYPVVLHTGGKASLTLRVFEVADSQFFTPPREAPEQQTP